MKYPLRTFWLLCILTSMLVTCTWNGRSDAPDLVGSWRWIQSSGGFTGATTYADSTGDVLNLTFKSNFTFSFIRNDTLIKQGKFNLGKENGKLIIHYNTEYGIDQEIRFQGTDTLILLDQCFDCYRSTYKRLPEIVEK